MIMSSLVCFSFEVDIGYIMETTLNSYSQGFGILQMQIFLDCKMSNMIYDPLFMKINISLSWR